MARFSVEELGPWLLGIDQKTVADLVDPRKCAYAQNLLLDEVPGAAITRQGSVEISTLPSALPARDVYVFSKADGTSYLLASDGATLYYTTDPSVQASWTSLKAGLNTDGFMEFETAEDKVWMTNGIDAVMSWDGTNLVIYDIEYQSTTDAAAVTTTTIQHTGLTQADDAWNGKKLVFTVGANQGIVVTITDFVAATDTLTFTPAVTGAVAITDRWKLGSIIPKGRSLRFWDGKLWSGSTTDNSSEMRFHRPFDPNTGTFANIDNPLAWPATYQIYVYSADGDRIWGISPVFRDRFLVHKATGLYRIERDPLTMYRVEVVSRAIGSRFPRAWVERNERLEFFGQDKDGLPDVFKTDMAGVMPLDAAGGLEPTLRALKQPNALQKSIVLTSESDFDAGSKSTGLKTSAGTLTLIGTAPAIFSSSNLDTIDGAYHGLVGIPDFTVRYEGDVLPQSATPAWTVDGPSRFSVASGVLTLAGSYPSVQTTRMTRTGVFTATKNVTVTARVAADVDSFSMGAFNGSKGAYFGLQWGGPGSDAWKVNSSLSVGTLPFDPRTYRIYTLQLNADATYKIFVDGVLWLSGTAVDTARNEVVIGRGLTAGTTGSPDFGVDGGAGPILVDKFYYDTDSDAIGSSIALTGEVVYQFDYTRTPDALGRIYAALTDNGATVVMSSWSSGSSDFSTDNDGAGYIVFANGAQPTSAIKRHLRVKFAITAANQTTSPTLAGIYGCALWVSAAQFIGSSIASWRTLLATITTPASTALTIKIRRATVTTTPVEGDWGSWATIISGDNIGTILSDATPPTSRWVQIKIELAPSSAGALPSADALTIQWNEGSAVILPLLGIVHKKRALWCAAQSTSSANDRVIVYDRNDAPMIYTGWSLNAMVHFKSLLIGFSSANAKVINLDVAGLYNDLGSAIDAYLDTREERAKSPELRKNYRYGYVHGGRSAFTLSTSYKRPGDSDFTGAASLTFTANGGSVRQNFGLGTVGRGLQRRYRCNTLDQKMYLLGESIYFDKRGPQP